MLLSISGNKILLMLFLTLASTDNLCHPNFEPEESFFIPIFYFILGILVGTLIPLCINEIEKERETRFPDSKPESDSDSGFESESRTN